MYARHIDQLDQLGDLVAQDHQQARGFVNSAGTLPDCWRVPAACHFQYYDGEIATPEVMSAWGAAYGQLADILIGARGGHF